MTMKKFVKNLIAVLLVCVGVFFIGRIMGDNETAIPAGQAALYLIVTGIYFYHNYRSRDLEA